MCHYSTFLNIQAVYVEAKLTKKAESKENVGLNTYELYIGTQAHCARTSKLSYKQ